MKKRRLGEIVLAGVVAVVFFASISRGASFGPKLKGQEAQEEKSKTIELTGILKNIPDGKHDLEIDVLDGDDELLFSKVFKGVQVNEGFYSLKINTQEAGLEIGRTYGLRIEVLGEEEIPVIEAKLEIVPGLTVRALGEEGQGVSAGLYNITGNYPYPDAVVTVTNRGTGYGIKSVSQKGVGLHAESNALAGYGLYAKNTAGGTALFSEGKAKVEGDLEVIGQASLTNVDLPADSVGSAEIINGTITEIDISPTASINADTLDNKDSTEFLATSPAGDLMLNGNLTVNGAGNNYFAGNIGIGTTTPASILDVISNTADHARNAFHYQAINPSFRLDATANGNHQSGIFFQKNGQNRWGILNDFNGNDSQTFAIKDMVAGFSRFFINDLGNLGVGTTNPEAMLHISTADSSGETDLLKLSRGVSYGATILSEYYNADNDWGLKIKDSRGITNLIINGGNGSIRTDGNVTIYKDFSWIAPALTVIGHGWGGQTADAVALDAVTGAEDNRHLKWRTKTGDPYAAVLEVQGDESLTGHLAVDGDTQIGGNLRLSTLVSTEKLDIDGGARIYKYSSWVTPALTVLGHGEVGKVAVAFEAITGAGDNKSLKWRTKAGDEYNAILEVQGDELLTGHLTVGGDAQVGNELRAAQIHATGDICTDAGGGKCLSNAGGGGGGIGGSGTTNQIAKFTTATTIGDSAISDVINVNGNVHNISVDGNMNIDGNLTANAFSNVRIVQGDSSSAIQSAIDSLPDSGGKVFLPAGTYNIDAAIKISSNVTLQGAGASTILKQTMANINILKNLDDTGNSRIIIKDMMIDADNKSTGSDRAGIYLIKPTYCHIENVIIINAFRGVRLDHFTAKPAEGFRSDTTLDNVHVVNAIDKAFALEGIDHITLSNCIATSLNKEGFWASNADYVTLVNCQAIENGESGFKPSYGSGYWTFSSCIARNNGWAGFEVAETGPENGNDGGHHVFNGCTAEGNGTNPASLWKAGFLTTVSKVAFQGCYAHGNQGPGLRIETSERNVNDIVVSGGTYEQNNTAGIQIYGHRVKNPDYPPNPEFFYYEVNGVTINGVRASGPNQDYGIQVKHETAPGGYDNKDYNKNIIAVGNDCRGNGTGIDIINNALSVIVEHNL